MRPGSARSPLWIILALVMALLSSQTISAQEPEFNDHRCSDCRRPWSFRFIPYGWIPGLDGDVTVGRVTAPLDVSVGKTLDIMIHDINVAAIGQIEATNGKFGFIFNGVYGDESPDRNVRNVEFTTRFRTAILDCALTYVLDGIPERLNLSPDSRFELLAGVRYNSISAGLTITGPRGNTAGTSGTEDWVDPFFGARLRVPLCRCWTAQVRGDIGGFDIGESSQLTWNIEAVLEYRCSNCLSFFAGYRWLDIDYITGTGRQTFGFDTNLNGPLVGFAFDF